MRYPRIYDVGLRPAGELRTAEVTDLKIKQVPLSTVTVTVPAQDIGSFGYRQFVEIFDAGGKRVDMFRVARKPSGKVGGMVKLACDQVLCTLKDDIVPGYVQLGGTTQDLREAVQAVLGYQRVKRWALARCDYDTHFEYGLSDENLLSALLMLIEPLDSPMIVTDTTTTPWQLSIVRLTDEDASELRYTRNLTEIDEVIEDDGFATRLYPRGYGEGVNQLTIRDVNGGCEYIEAPQAVRDLWGTVSQPYVDTTCTDAATLKAKAEAALAICQHPQVSYKVKGVDLHLLTGEPMDTFYAGRMARMIYTDYGFSLRARVVEIHYPKPIAKPGEVNLTISSQSASVATVIAELARKSAINELYGQGSTFIFADSIEQNADKDTPAEGDIYIPESMLHINAIMLKVVLSAYRADSKGAAGGGGTVQSTKEGGGGTRTSEAGGMETITVKAQTVSIGIKHTGYPLGEDGGSCLNTGLPTDLLGARVTTTENYDGSTTEAGGDISVSVPKLNGQVMSYTGEGGPTSTGAASANTGAPLNAASGSSMTSTGTGGPTNTGSGGGGETGSGSGNTGTPLSAASGSSMTSTGTGGPTATGGANADVTVSNCAANTGTSSPGTNSAGGHSHTVNSHTHSFSDTQSLANGHYHNITNPGTSKATAGVSTNATHSVSISGTTGSKSPGTDSAGSHSHTVDSHAHSMTHSHSVTQNKHSHSVEQHSHGMNHYHAGGSHKHSLSAHSHSVEQHSHGMNHYHAGGSHRHSIDQHTHLMAHTHTLSTRHSHSISHAHGFDHIHNMSHVHNMAHDHTIPSQSITIPSHSHNVSIPSHSHEIELADHEHSIVYGIFKGPRATDFVVEVDGAEVPARVFSDQGIGDIAPYLGTDSSGKIRRGAFHTLAIRPVATEDNPGGLCRVRASWSAQVFISSLTGKQY